MNSRSLHRRPRPYSYGARRQPLGRRPPEEPAPPQSDWILGRTQDLAFLWLPPLSIAPLVFVL
jgi:hypothetical protein